MTSLVIGTQIGRLTIVKTLPKKIAGGKPRTAYLCRCSCGNEVEVLAQNLKSKSPTKSCSCLQKEITIENNTTHGMCGTPLYRRWRSMMDRCYVKSAKMYHHYGGRGITVCDEWKNFDVFYRDNKDIWSPALELDRIDNNGNYSPRNCRWATRKEQCNNTRRNRLITFQGKTMNVTQWSNLLGINKSALSYRLRKGLPNEIVFSKLNFKGKKLCSQ